jgi:hypothetical protein
MEWTRKRRAQAEKNASSAHAHIYFAIAMEKGDYHEAGIFLGGEFGRRLREEVGGDARVKDICELAVKRHIVSSAFYTGIGRHDSAAREAIRALAAAHYLGMEGHQVEELQELAVRRVAASGTVTMQLQLDPILHDVKEASDAKAGLLEDLVRPNEQQMPDNVRRIFGSEHPSVRRRP